MLPWHQRRSRRMNSISVGGFSSQLDFLAGAPDFVAGAAHQRRLDLIVAEDMAVERAAFGQRRQAAIVR